MKRRIQGLCDRLLGGGAPADDDGFVGNEEAIEAPDASVVPVLRVEGGLQVFALSRLLRNDAEAMLFELLVNRHNDFNVGSEFADTKLIDAEGQCLFGVIVDPEAIPGGMVDGLGRK